MTRRQALQYIRNTDGGATVADFVDDWMPVGHLEWPVLLEAGLVEVRDNRIFLTAAGDAKLAELEQ